MQTLCFGSQLLLPNKTARSARHQISCCSSQGEITALYDMLQKPCLQEQSLQPDLPLAGGRQDNHAQQTHVTLSSQWDADTTKAVTMVQKACSIHGGFEGHQIPVMHFPVC